MRNFNTVFHLVSGLNHGLVQRLRSTWEKVPHKHKKVFEVIIARNKNSVLVFYLAIVNDVQ